MLPAAGFLFVYWVMCFKWLLSLEEARRADRLMLALGVIGTAFLILYATFLGSDGDTYRLLRRYGTVVYFGFTYLAQVLLTRRLAQLLPSSTLVRWQIGLLAFILVTGLVFAAAANLVEDDDYLQNISEWNCASALTAFPLLTWLLWRRTGFRVSVATPSRMTPRRGQPSPGGMSACSLANRFVTSGIAYMRSR